MRRSPTFGPWPPLALGAAVLTPLLLTALLVGVNFNSPRDYIFLYLGIVAVLGVSGGLGPSLVAAMVSFLAVDYLFVRPVHTLSIDSGDDVVNLLVFFGAAGLVGSLGSRRRAAQLRAEALAGELQSANVEMMRLNEEQAEAARVAVALARSEQQVRLLEETDRLRGELLANVSHELRTPLGSILTGTTAMLARPEQSPGLHDELSLVAGEAHRLGRLVSDMLDMTRIEGHALDLHPAEVDLHDAVEAATTRLRMRSPDRAMRVTAQDPLPEVIADWDRLGQVLDNLLLNADRHAPQDTPIELRLSAAGRWADVHVVDHGPGVPEELRPRIFERFVRGADAAADGGTGLGLAIVRGLVKAQGGSVWLAESRPGEGGHFGFRLPAAASDVTG